MNWLGSFDLAWWNFSICWCFPWWNLIK